MSTPLLVLLSPCPSLEKATFLSPRSWNSSNCQTLSHSLPNYAQNPVARNLSHFTIHFLALVKVSLDIFVSYLSLDLLLGVETFVILDLERGVFPEIPSSNSSILRIRF